MIAEDPHDRPWISVYDDADGVSRHLESWFPAEYDYRAFDADGRSVELFVESGGPARFLGRWRRAPDRVAVRLRDVAARPQELRELLLRFLEDRGGIEDLHDAPLGALIERASVHG